MLKKIIVCCAVMGLVGFSAFAQEKSPSKSDGKMSQEAPKSPRVTNKGDYAEVSFGQPSKRDREIFGALVPYGEVWRTGANMSTDVTFYKDVKIDGKDIKKGTYAIFTIPAETSWTVYLNSVPAQKGASEFQQNKSKNVLEIKVPVGHLDAVQEQLNIVPEKEGIIISWDKTRVVVPVAVAG